MNCEQARQHWHLFHDSEGDPELHQRINAHLSMCPLCARWYFQQDRLENGLTDTLRQDEPSSAMWDRISKSVLSIETVSPLSRSLLGRFLALTVSMLVFGSLVFWNYSDRESHDLTALSVGLHEKLATGREKAMFSSGSHLEIEAYLRRQVAFPVRCPPREDAGFLAQGGGVCSFDGAAVAYVVGQVDGRPVSIFILSRESLADFPRQAESLQHQKIVSQQHANYDVLMGEVNQNLVLVVGQIAAERLDRVLKAYGSYHEHAPHAPPALPANDSA